MLEFRVTDTGPGLDEAKMKVIFDPFVSYRGSVGLGLFLVQQQAGTVSTLEPAAIGY